MTPDTFGCVNHTIRLASGIYFDFDDPQPSMIHPLDIAASLSKLCRFNGHTHRFYSVAEHSIHAAREAKGLGCTPEEQLAVLMHDATEAYVGDCVKPLKIMLPDFIELEARIEDAIGARFGICFMKHAKLIKEIDQALVIAERKAMFSKDDVIWKDEHTARLIEVEFKYMNPLSAEVCFEGWLKKLGGIAP